MQRCYATCDDSGHGKSFPGGKSCGTGPCAHCQKQSAMPVHIPICMDHGWELTLSHICMDCKRRHGYRRIDKHTTIDNVKLAEYFGLHGVFILQ